MVSTNDCLIYALYKNGEGYGVNLAGGVHRQMYEHFIGPIPEGYEVDHLCEVKSCINPDHLEAVTHKINSQRGNRKRRNEYCRRGLHKLEGENVMLYRYKSPAGNMTRQCRACFLTRKKELYHQRKLKEQLPKEKQ